MAAKPPRRRSTPPKRPTRPARTQLPAVTRPRVPAVPAAPSWERVLAAFLDTRESPETRRAYARRIRAAFAFFGAEGRVRSVADVTGEMLGRYRRHVTEAKRPGTDAPRHSPAAQSQAIAALRAFLRYARAVGAGRHSDELLKFQLKVPSAKVLKPYKVAGERDIGILLGVAHTPRDRALLAVLFGCGLRAAELVGLDVASLHDTDEGLVLHVRGKGRKDRVIPTQADVRGYVLEYLAATGRRLDARGPLFRAHDYGASQRPLARLSTRSVGYLVKRRLQDARLAAKGLSPHAMRHSFAIRALRNGASVVAVAKLLGHSSVTITQRYLDHLELGELRAAVPPLPPAA